MSFNEQDVVRDTTGRFDEKNHSAPEVTLGSATSDTPAIQALGQARSLFAAAQDTYMKANRAAAVAELRDAFPGSSVAIFARNWDEDRPRLIQVLGETDYDLDEDGEKLSREQMKACATADMAIQAMGDDDNVLNYLDGSEEEHDDWFEFQLPLNAEPELLRPVDNFLERTNLADRSALDGGLSQRDGRLYSVVDTHEIALRLEDDVYIGDAELSDALTQKFGTLDAAAGAIADSRSYEQFRQYADGLVSEQLNDGIEEAARSVLGD